MSASYDACTRVEGPLKLGQERAQTLRAEVKMVSGRRWRRRRSLRATLWIAGFMLGIALITGILGGTGARAAPHGQVLHPTYARSNHGPGLPGMHARLL